ncbi:MAG TPA: MFS transporter [Chloroflexia bacterium]|nr:MFS transporter [Chloroflexia bacterium]
MQPPLDARQGDPIPTPLAGEVTVGAGQMALAASEIAEVPAETVEVEKFDAGKAARYAVANYGASNVWMLFNTGMPLYLNTYGLHPALIALLANERSFVGALVQPIVGRISDRTRTPLGRRRPFFLIGIPLMSVAIALLALHPPFWIMLGIMTIAAFFLWVAIDPYMALMADLFPPEHRGRVGGFQGLANALGAITFSLMAFMLWEKNEPWVFAIVIILLIVTWAFTFFTVKEPPLLPYVKPDKSQRPSPMVYVRELFSYSQASRYTLAMTLFWMGNGGAAPFVTLFGTQSLGATEGESFLLPLAYIAVTALLSVPAGMLADRFGKKQVISIGLLIYGVGAIIGSQSPNLLVATFALAVIGMGNACVAILIALFTDMIPKVRAAEMVGLFSAVTSFAQPLGAALAGLVVGWVEINSGIEAAYRWAFIVAGIFILLGLGVLQTVKPKRGMEESRRGDADAELVAVAPSGGAA